MKEQYQIFATEYYPNDNTIKQVMVVPSFFHYKAFVDKAQAKQALAEAITNNEIPYYNKFVILKTYCR